MRRIAAHRIYLLPQAEWRSASVIELNEAGEVVRVSPLTEEGAHIEWLSGEIIVSPFPLVRESQENFQAFLSRITKQAKAYADSVPRRAYRKLSSSSEFSAYDCSGYRYIQ